MTFRRFLLVLVIALGLAVLFFPGYTKFQQMRNRSLELEEKIKKLKIENALLQQELKRIEEDPFYQEKIARERMGVVRKGEIPIRIVPQDGE